MEYVDASSILSHHCVTMKDRLQLLKEFCDRFLSHELFKGEHINEKKELDWIRRKGSQFRV